MIRRTARHACRPPSLPSCALASLFAGGIPISCPYIPPASLVPCDKIASYCSELLRKARCSPPQKKTPTVGSGSIARMVIASFFPRSLGHTHIIKGNPPFSVVVTKEVGAFQRRGTVIGQPAPVCPIDLGKGAPGFCRVLSAAIPQNSLKFGAYPSGIKQKKNKWNCQSSSRDKLQFGTATHFDKFDHGLLVSSLVRSLHFHPSAQNLKYPRPNRSTTEHMALVAGARYTWGRRGDDCIVRSSDDSYVFP